MKEIGCRWRRETEREERRGGRVREEGDGKRNNTWKGENGDRRAGVRESREWRERAEVGGGGGGEGERDSTWKRKKGAGREARGRRAR